MRAMALARGIGRVGGGPRQARSVQVAARGNDQAIARAIADQFQPMSLPYPLGSDLVQDCYLDRAAAPATPPVR
jgi:hypothetical protein